MSKTDSGKTDLTTEEIVERVIKQLKIEVVPSRNYGSGGLTVRLLYKNKLIDEDSASISSLQNLVRESSEYDD